MGVATIAVNVFIQTIADKTGYIDSPEAVCIACDTSMPGARKAR